MTVLIVCQAGPGVGLGHLARCLVAARALAGCGFAARLLIQGPALRRDDLGAFPHEFIPQGAPLPESVLRAIREHDARLVIFDLQPRLVPKDMGALLFTLKSQGRRTVAVDGLLEHAVNLDLMFIPSFHFSPPPGLPLDANVLSGWDCYLLNVQREPVTWKPGKRILTLTGGSDVTKLGAILPGLLNEALSKDAELSWVTGPYADQPVWPRQPRLRMTNHQAPPGLDGLMMDADYALTIFGVSFFELLYYGVPTVVFSPYGGKDQAELAGISEQRVALVAKDEVEAVAMLRALMADDGLAAGLSRNARQKMSTPGAQRLARAVAELME